MKRAEPQNGQAQSRSAARQGGGAALASPQGERTAQMEALADGSPQAQKLAGLAAMMNASPAMAAQAKLFESIHNSPRQIAQKKAFDAIHDSPVQVAQRRKFENPFDGAAQRAEAPAKPNNTGLPDGLKSGIESLSGISMDNVKVHYNSSQPAQLNALAYAQGTDIHVAHGQEKHLPHEAWHVVQQAQGRVQPTMQMKGGMPVNDDNGLEREADAMGERAAQTLQSEDSAFEIAASVAPRPESSMPLQRIHDNGERTGKSAQFKKMDNSGSQSNGSRAQASVRPVIQRNEPDLSNTSLDNEEEDQARAVDSVRSAYRAEIGKELIGAGLIEEPVVPSGFWNLAAWNPFKKAPEPAELPAVVNYENAVWEIIDELLPEILNYLPFENGLAGIRFAQDIFKKHLLQSPGLLEDEDIEGVLRSHLQEVIANLPVGGDKEEDAEGEEGETGRTTFKPAGKEDKRYKAALARIKEKRGQSEKEPSLVEKAGKKETADDEKLYTEEEDKFNKIFAKESEDCANYIVELVRKMPRLKGYRFLKLLNTHAGRQGDRGYFIYELHLTFHTGLISGFPSHSPERMGLAKKFVALKLLADNETDAFYAGRGAKDENGAMHETDKSIKETEKDRGLNRKKLIQEDKLLQEEKKQKDQAELESRFNELCKKSSDFIGALSEIHPLKASVASVFLLEVIEKARAGSGKVENLLESYEDYFALQNWEPGNKARAAMVNSLRKLDLLPGVDHEVLKYGAKSAASITEDAKSGGWITGEEVEVGSKLLGPRAFVGILASHMRRGKPGPLRAMVEQLVKHRDLIKLAPPLTNTSLILDTNMVEILVTPFSGLSKNQKHLRVQLNGVIAKEGITDIRLSNMNIAELSGYGRLIGTVVNVEIGEDGKEIKKLQVFGVPYNTSRGSGRYDEVFRAMEEKKVGENKGDADRSMMADIYMADREKDAVAHFATADLGVVKEIGERKEQFNPEAIGLPKVGIHTMGQLPQDVIVPPKDQDKPPVSSGNHPVWDFKIGSHHTVTSITELINKAGFQVFVVGGAVRDFIRGSKINDVDMKTDMPVDELAALLEKNHLAVSVTSAINLVTVGQDENSADIVSTSSKGKAKKVDLRADALTRDFTLNALFLDPSKRVLEGDVEIDDPLQAEEHAETGLLRFTADPGVKDVPEDKGDPNYKEKYKENFRIRAKAILEHLRAKPENFGRALKFLERGHDAWRGDWKLHEEKMKQYRTDLARYQLRLAAYPEKLRAYQRLGKRRRRKLAAPRSPAPPVRPAFKLGPYYHLDADVLEMLRKNAHHILEPLTTDHMAPHKKGLFIHQAGFKSPMEMVDVMRRLNFPSEAIQMIIPDTVAGAFGDRQLAYSRDVSPRFLPVGPISEWDPEAAPRVKVDMVTGRVYQYRVYAYVEWNNAEQKLLIDVDFSDHGVKGHPSPHYHVYRVTGGAWKKDKSGYSNTGQPGEPPLKFVNGRRKFEGPVTWEWWDGVDKDKNDDKALREALTSAAKNAGEELTFSENDMMVDIGGQITLPLVRIRQLAENERIPKLLLLVHNLNDNMPWNPEDDTVQELTGSKDMRERLRFKPQLDSVSRFLKEACGIENETEIKPGKLTDAERARLFDLSHGGYSDEQCLAASKFAREKMGSVPDPLTFANFFEYYIAATKNRVSKTDLNLLHRRTITWASDMYVGGKIKLTGKDYAAELKKNAAALNFADANTAAYHLHKHLDMVKQTPEMLQQNDSLGQAGSDYMKICHEAVEKGHLKKQVSETLVTAKFYFEHGENMAVVEVNTETHDAHLLTCFNTASASPIFLNVQYLPSPDSQSGSGTKDHKPEEQRDTIYRTPFGPYIRKHTALDGNCFFNAINVSAGLNQSAAALRAMAAKELRDHYDHDFNGTTYTDFITGRNGTAAVIANATADYLAGDGNWARDDGDLVPELMARALRRTIHILSRSTGALVATMGPPNSNPIVIFYNGRTHYESAIRQG